MQKIWKVGEMYVEICGLYALTNKAILKNNIPLLLVYMYKAEMSFWSYN